ncbi:MAG: hypothetical protein PHX21_11890 [bacterium]|nr:hypothetical protein [bacterium]
MDKNLKILLVLFMVFFCKLSDGKALFDRRFNWDDIQEVGGLTVDKPERNDAQYFIPIFCDVSGAQEVTVKPQKLNSGLVFKEFKYKIKGNRIYFYLVATLPGGKYKSPKTKGIYLKGIKPGDYEVYYLDSDKKSVLLRTVEFKNPEEVRQEQLKEPTDYLKKTIILLESLDFYSQERDGIFRRIEPTEHWLCKNGKELEGIFSGIKEIRSVYIKKSIPEIYESQKYFPEVFVEEWVFEGKEKARESISRLDKFRESDKMAAGDLLLKAPIIWWQEGERIYVLHTRAEMFRDYLTKIEKTMKDVLSQPGPESLH